MTKAERKDEEEEVTGVMCETEMWGDEVREREKSYGKDWADQSFSSVLLLWETSVCVSSLTAWRCRDDGSHCLETQWSRTRDSVCLCVCESVVLRMTDRVLTSHLLRWLKRNWWIFGSVQSILHWVPFTNFHTSSLWLTTWSHLPFNELQQQADWMTFDFNAFKLMRWT